MTVASTSIAVYHMEIKGEREDSQDKIILDAMIRIGRAAAMREIQEETIPLMEINAVSRSLNNLRTKLKKIDFFDAVYKGRKVHHYFLIDLPVQTKLF
jgi:uncharacterized protein (DUF4213/DUF364 family)